MNMPHVLIVDDEPGVLDVCARALRRSGLEVTTASDAKTARILLQSHTVDMLITDLLMPGEGGISLLQSVHETDPDLPLMIITAYPDVASVDAALNLNVKSFIPKPFNIADFVDDVKRNLGLKETRKAKLQSELAEWTPIFVGELRRHQVPVLEGRIRRDPENGQLVLSPNGGEGQIPLEEWLLGYQGYDSVYLVVLPQE